MTELDVMRARWEAACEFLSDERVRDIIEEFPDVESVNTSDES